ncbi:MAG: lysophospholipid acyltransferase family protein [Verrucomicrobiota bacterium]|nr:lysophospholipid acyltransferase family protein [Chthoniobacterales bacterium]MBA3762893.1 lysophospholipid acyltransferase family protein [Chthoniobacterales bacterium]MDQ3313494.1 lysophospholipid acyltransferase family protein [Verrucomicrobiota bacterium]
MKLRRSVRDKLKIEGRAARWLIALGYHFLELWARTLRFEIEDRADLFKLPTSERVIGALWHNRLLLLPYIGRRFIAKRPTVALISASRDGNLLADFVARYGVGVARGSSSRRGASAMLQLADEIAAGRDVVITPDGPRGPVYEMGPGIVFLAQKSKTPVLLMNFEYSSCWRLRSWDRFILPKPCSTVRVILGAFHRVAETSTAEGFEAERLRLQSAMMQFVERP